jgi:transposase
MSKKRLAERLKEQRGKKSQPNKGLVAIYSKKDEIQEALEQKFTLKEIHALLSEEGEMPIKYSAFCRLVNKYITIETPKKRIQHQTPSENKAEGEKKTSPNISKRPDYVFDPDRNKDKISKQLGMK